MGVSILISLTVLLGAACTSRSDSTATEPGSASGAQADFVVDDESQEVAGPRRSSGPEKTDPEPDENPADPDTDNDDPADTDPDNDDPIGTEAPDEPEPEGPPRRRDTGPTTVEPVFLFPASRGDSGDAVKALQSRLANLGFAPGPADGSYGTRTGNAVAAFQFLVDLEQTGNADDRTIAELGSYYYDGLILSAGDEGPDVAALQQRLADGPFDPGAIDGQYSLTTIQAVWALEKLAGMPVDGNWGPLDEKAWQLLQSGAIGGPVEDHEQRWVEVSLSEQLVKVYDPGQTTPTLISHISSGSGRPWSNDEYSGSSITPIGDFEITRRISGWRESSLNIGRLYNPLYFRGGIAFHGATSVPLYPASHGCVRVPMHIAEYLPGELPNGTAVHVDA